MKNSMAEPRKLLMLTKHFPFNEGYTPAESYLETEILTLAMSFDEVLIIASEAVGENEPICDLPENVSAIELEQHRGATSKALLAARGALLPVVGSGKTKDAFHGDWGIGLPAFVFEGYYIAKAKRKYDAILGVLQKRDFTPTYIYSFWFFDTSLVASWIKQDTGAVCYSRAHRYDLYPERNSIGYLPCREYQLKWNDRVFPCSKDGLDYLLDRYSEWEGKIHLSYLGTKDLPDCTKRSSSGTFSIVSCSSLVPTKRAPLIAEALKLIGETDALIKWTHFGDGPEMGKLKEVAKSVPNADVELRGNVSNELLLQEYSKMQVDLFVNVSSSEGLPISIMEACGHGFPVLATNVGGTSEIVKDGVNGALLPEHLSKEQLANELKRFYEMPEESRRAMRSASRRIWQESFQTKNNALSLLDEVFSIGEKYGKGCGGSDNE